LKKIDGRDTCLRAGSEGVALYPTQQ